MDIDVKDPKVVRWLLAVLVILVLVPVYFFTTVLPVTYKARRAEIAKLDARHQELGRDLEKARLLVRNLARVEKEYEILHEQWSVAQMLLPQKNEMPALLRKVTAAGSQSGVEFQLFKPGAPVAREFYAENPVEVKVQGGYHQFGIFLSRLANLNRIVNVGNLKLKGLDKQDEQPYAVEATMTISAYTLEGAGAPPSTDQGDGSRKLAQSGSPADDKGADASGGGAKTKNPVT
ncbi:MAG: type IV pilus inner membrane component PilO, partial [Candidatus Krumholzibacteriia bacterium]